MPARGSAVKADAAWRLIAINSSTEADDISVSAPAATSEGFMDRRKI
jgi:hypothetical protein